MYFICEDYYLFVLGKDNIYGIKLFFFIFLDYGYLYYR